MCKRRAFTQIEVVVLVIVVVFVVVVSTVALFMLSQRGVRKQARSIACRSKLKQWGLYFAMYTEDYNSRFMAGHTGLPQPNRWISALGDYYKWDDEFTCCPEATTPWIDKYGKVSSVEGTNVGVNMAWGYMNQSHWKKPMKGSYGINGWIVDAPPGDVPRDGNPDWFWRRPNVTGAGNVPLFLEAQRYNGWPLDNDKPPDNSGEESSLDAQMGRYCLNRHDGFANVLFMDWSVRQVGLKELWTLKWHRSYNPAGTWTLDGGVKPDSWPKWMRKFRDY